MQSTCLQQFIASLLKIESISDQKPSIILFYNKTKDGVDTLNRMVRSYFTKRTTRSWPLVLFYNMIDVSAINALIIWQSGINHENGNMCMRQKRKFLISLGKDRCRITDYSVAPYFCNQKWECYSCWKWWFIEQESPMYLV